PAIAFESISRSLSSEPGPVRMTPSRLLRRPLPLMPILSNATIGLAEPFRLIRPPASETEHSSVGVWLYSSSQSFHTPLSQLAVAFAPCQSTSVATSVLLPMLLVGP